MRSSKLYKKRGKNWRKVMIVVLIVAAILTVGGLLTASRIYTSNLKAVNSSDETNVTVTIQNGTSLNEIASLLKTKALIRTEWAFTQYVRSHELVDSLKAGTYKFKPNQDVASIVDDLVAGKVAVDLFTILPGQRLDQIRDAFIKNGYTATEVDQALDPSNYTDMPALVDKPVNASLEGYLYPDSFQRTADTLASTIVRASLNEMGDALTAELRSAYAAEGLTTHKAITLASIVEREVSSQDDRNTAAQVFLTRIKKGMRLQSDVTVLYGQVMAGKDTKYVDTSFESGYNTFLHDGLPVGPISNVSKSGLYAVAHPSSSDYIYFVAGDGDDYGKTYFTRTIAEHQAAVAAHCKSCSQ